MFKSKKLVALGLAAVALFSTVGVSLAYWASSVAGASANKTATINIGEGNAITTSVAVADFAETLELVPAGYGADGYNDAAETESVTVSFSISWESTGDDANGAVKTLTITQTAYTVGGSPDTYSLINIQAAPAPFSITADAAAVNVTMTVTMDEPANLAQYTAVAGKAIVISYSFVVA